MLRLGPSAGPTAPAADPTALPDQMTAASDPKMLPMAPDPKTGSMGKYDAEKVKPEVARYLTSDQGPFECQNCHHYLGNSCEIVSGPIDPEGVCCLFESAGGGSDEEAQDDESGGAADQAPPLPTTNPLG